MRVAVAVDGSPASLEAVREACRIFRNNAVIDVVAVNDEGAFMNGAAAEASAGASVDDMAVFVKDWEQTAAQTPKKVMRILAECGQVGTWRTLTAKPGDGGAAQVFYRQAVKDGVHAIFVGSHSGTTWAEEMLGSFPHWLITHSRLPVTVVPVQPAGPANPGATE